MYDFFPPSFSHSPFTTRRLLCRSRCCTASKPTLIISNDAFPARKLHLTLPPACPPSLPSPTPIEIRPCVQCLGAFSSQIFFGLWRTWRFGHVSSHTQARLPVGAVVVALDALCGASDRSSDHNPAVAVGNAEQGFKFGLAHII